MKCNYFRPSINSWFCCVIHCDSLGYTSNYSYQNIFEEKKTKQNRRQRRLLFIISFKFFDLCQKKPKIRRLKKLFFFLRKFWLCFLMILCRVFANEIQTLWDFVLLNFLISIKRRVLFGIFVFWSVKRKDRPNNQYTNEYFKRAQNSNIINKFTIYVFLLFDFVEIIWVSWTFDWFFLLIVLLQRFYDQWKLSLVDTLFIFYAIFEWSFIALHCIACELYIPLFYWRAHSFIQKLHNITKVSTSGIFHWSKNPHNNVNFLCIRSK